MKNLITGAIAFLVIGIIAFVYIKFYSPKAVVAKEQAAKKEDADTIISTLEADKKLAAAKQEKTLTEKMDQLTEAQRSKVSALANRIYLDMKGLGAHDSRLYKEILNLDDTEFALFASTSFPRIAGKSLRDRLKAQDWNAVTYASWKVYSKIVLKGFIGEIYGRLDKIKL